MVSVEIDKVTPAEYASRLRALLRKGGITNGLPRKTRDRLILLHAIAQEFAPDDRMTEIEATARIGAFLTARCPHWHIDRVTLRRALVDDGFLDRDSNGAEYRRSPRHESKLAFESPPAIESILGAPPNA
jgi:hypothetical protein